MSARIPKTTVCLWYDRDAENAAKFYARTFPGSAVRAARRAPGDYPNGKEGDVLVVEFTVLGVPSIGPGEAANRAFAAMMTMKKIDIAAIEAAVPADA